jgi:hypothetical protein
MKTTFAACPACRCCYPLRMTIEIIIDKQCVLQTFLSQNFVAAIFWAPLFLLLPNIYLALVVLCKILLVYKCQEKHFTDHSLLAGFKMAAV